MSTSSPSPEPAAADDDAATGPGTPAPASADPAATAPVHRVVDVADPSRVRRAPRYGRFAFFGLVLGAVVSFGLTFLPGADDGLGRRDLFFLLLLSFGSLGLVLGLVVALLVDRRSMRRGR